MPADPTTERRMTGRPHIPLCELPDLPGAACAGTDPERWFPDHGDPTEAETLCGQCPVKARCLQWALEHGIRWGIWGGTTPVERESLTPPRPVRRDLQERRCDDCSRLMVSNRQLHREPQLKTWYVMHAGHGICMSCRGKRRRTG